MNKIVLVILLSVFLVGCQDDKFNFDDCYKTCIDDTINYESFEDVTIHDNGTITTINNYCEYCKQFCEFYTEQKLRITPHTRDVDCVNLGYELILDESSYIDKLLINKYRSCSILEKIRRNKE